ncbi:MAG: hypothetical protein ACREQY_23940 [Candidatus Binatia bacterium]
MSPSDAISKDLDRQILDAHERFTGAIAARLPTMDAAQKERYFVLVSKLASRLEETEKPLKQVLQEAVGELLPIVMQELSS